MKYFELTFTLSPCSETAQDVLSAVLADIGFETFVPGTDDTLQAYIQQAQYDEKALENTIQNFPIPNIYIKYELSEPEHRDWNETWENEGFSPICVNHRLIVCAPHHQVDSTDENSIIIHIHPRQAFGTGSHQTTRMILSELLDLPLEGKNVIDAGCGTGILSFLCLTRGANKVLAYDIDEWSTQNTLDNALLNFSQKEIEHQLDVKLGDATCLEGKTNYDLLIANINRNILLSDMQRFAASIGPQGELLLSGFYIDDIPAIVNCARTYNFSLRHERKEGEWAMIRLSRS